MQESVSRFSEKFYCNFWNINMKEIQLQATNNFNLFIKNKIAVFLNAHVQ